MNIKSEFIQDWLGEAHGVIQSVSFDHVSIDSRSLQNGNSTLFFCLEGSNHNGHDYIPQLIQQGVQSFVVTQIPEKFKSSAQYWLVNDTKQALQYVAASYRKLFQLPVIAITGSNGKTTVKEWLNFLLSPDFHIVRSPKSFNSQVGVPLSVFGINEQHNLGIFEAGISVPNEMEVLHEILQPKIGIFTHLGSAHDEGFEDISEKIKEKLKLFSTTEIVILKHDNLVIEHLKTPYFTWSFENPKANVFVLDVTKHNQKTSIKIIYNSSEITFEIPFTDEVSIENSLTCITTLLYLKVEILLIQERISCLYPVEIRLQTIKGINNCTIIDDSFSSDYQSLKIALDFLELQKQHEKKTIILSDIFQSGLDVVTLYENVSKAILKNKIDRIIVIGETISQQLQDLPSVIAFPSTKKFLQQFNTHSFHNETILIKGARSFAFDEIVVLLEEKKHETTLEINLDAITHNLNFYKSKLKPTTKIMVMVKAFGYGNGGFELAKHLEFLNVSYLGVAFADEGIELRKMGIRIPIMVMNPEISSYNSMIAYDLEPEIYSFRGLETFLSIAKSKNLNEYPIHIKIDTGMHRLGFESVDIDQLVKKLKNNNLIKIQSVFSHLAASDDLNLRDFTLKQISDFSTIYNTINSQLGYQPLKHILNTSGIFHFTDYQFDMVRLGIGLYGFSNSDEELRSLENVSELKSVISQIKIVRKGESIGYSRKFFAHSTMRMATIPIGYADGISRLWGNEKGFVMINQQKAKIVGSVCMDMLMVDVTTINCNEGDEVILFGVQPNITEIATVCQTIPYEIITGISQRVKRIFYKK